MMYIAMPVIFFVLIFLIGMRAWFLLKHDKTGKMSFWEAVNEAIEEDGTEDKNNLK